MMIKIDYDDVHENNEQFNIEINEYVECNNTLTQLLNINCDFHQDTDLYDIDDEKHVAQLIMCHQSGVYQYDNNDIMKQCENTYKGCDIIITMSFDAMNSLYTILCNMMHDAHIDKQILIDTINEVYDNE